MKLILDEIIIDDQTDQSMNKDDGNASFDELVYDSSSESGEETVSELNKILPHSNENDVLIQPTNELGNSSSSRENEEPEAIEISANIDRKILADSISHGLQNLRQNIASIYTVESQTNGNQHT